MSKAPESSYTPDRKAIGHLLALTEPNIVVPDWQRNYSWEAEQVEAFWNDLIYFLDVEIPKGKFEYFLGSLVIVNTENGYRRLLDGQ